jgi:anti-sigma factor ChrR (cupin superfamily)
MRINANFSERIVVRPEDYQWVESPMAGVERMMLDRIGEEVARATSLVRYAPDSRFSKHVHTGGEEFFVLEGEFADEHRSFPAGSYVRNPIGTSHSPHVGEQGCVIFVKLQQFEPDDQAQFALDTGTAAWSPGLVPGLEVLSLHQFGREQVALVKWAPHTEFSRHTHWGGEEVLVLEGKFIDEHGEYSAGTWIRSPHQSSHTPYTGDEGALIYVKVGHLADMVS